MTVISEVSFESPSPTNRMVQVSAVAGSEIWTSSSDRRLLLLVPSSLGSLEKSSPLTPVMTPSFSEPKEPTVKRARQPGVVEGCPSSQPPSTFDISCSGALPCLRNTPLFCSAAVSQMMPNEVVTVRMPWEHVERPSRTVEVPATLPKASSMNQETWRWGDPAWAYTTTSCSPPMRGPEAFRNGSESPRSWTVYWVTVGETPKPVVTS
jgi:hypothetical protein